MSNEKRRVMRWMCLGLGALLLVSAVATLLIWQRGIRTSAEQAQSDVNTLRALMPTPQGATPEERRDNAMATVSLRGTDFVGLLEIPRYGCALPVGAEWGKLSKRPCRFDGSVYDRTLQIGATTQQGQCDFYRELSAGDAVLFTDMEGNRYRYTVTALRYARHADQATLTREPSDLTLFIKNIYAFEYLIVFCRVAG